MIKKAHDVLLGSHGDESRTEEEKAFADPKDVVTALLQQRKALTLHLITTLVALNEVNKELERMLLIASKGNVVCNVMMLLLDEKASLYAATYFLCLLLLGVASCTLGILILSVCLHTTPHTKAFCDFL